MDHTHVWKDIFRTSTDAELVCECGALGSWWLALESAGVQRTCGFSSDKPYKACGRVAVARRDALVRHSRLGQPIVVAKYFCAEHADRE